MTDTMRNLIRENPSIQLMREEARKTGTRTLWEHGLVKVVEGATSFKELVRVTR
jgi:type II secretory ATPase GspE/PulE/Tfp pilus assembly ATPase PilB-like protein